MLRATSASFVLLTAFSVCAFGQAHHAGELTVEPFSFRTYDGSAHSAELNHLWVRENRNGPSDRLIEVTFVRLRTAVAKPRSPVVFLPGGPGIPGTTLGRVPVYYQLFEKLLVQSDVILFDQRGIGMSSPNTQCPEGPLPPADVFGTDSGLRDALVARAQACAGYWRAKGLDLASFSTEASANDLEDLRRAIGVEKLSLLGHSYGTTLALETVRLHGEHLDRVVLAGVEGPDQALRMPLVPDFALRRLSDLAAASPKVGAEFPDTYGEFRRLLDRVRRAPLIIRIRSERTKQDIDVKVGAPLVQFAIMNMLSNGQKVDRVPGVVYSLAHGDASLLTADVQDLSNSLATGFSAMQFAVACSDGWSPGRRKLALEQAAKSVFGEAPFVHLDPRLCSAVGAADPASDALLPLWSSVPILIVSGTLDSNTPAFQSEEVLWGLSNGRLLVVENGFHETLPSPNVQEVVAEFLGGGDIRRQVVQFAPPEFLTIDQANTLPGRAP